VADGGPAEKLASQVARRIESMIIERGWPVGSVLGSEPDLRERFGVSRSVLREAVRLTEHHQVTRMRRGPGGGLVVAAPDAGPALQALVVYLEYVGLSVEDLIEARLLLEPIAAASAAERVGEEDVVALRATLAAEVHHGDRPDLDAHLHIVLAQMAGNPVLELLVDVLTRLTANRVYSTGRLTPTDVDEARERARGRHEAIVAAVIGGDADLAAAETADHLRDAAEWLLDKRNARRESAPPTLEPTVGPTMAETVATRLLGDVVQRGWPIGAVLGSESALLARLGVSRSVLREAVRILEYHSIARTRRGPGGGLVVTRPDVDATVGAAALYLDYRQVGHEHLRIAREAIELGALSTVLARHADPAVARALTEAIRLAEDPAGHTGPEHFHAELVRLSGNPLLALFLRILTELWERHTAGKGGVTRSPDTVAAVRHVHTRILEAVLAGDEDLARHRLRRHLAALDEWYD